MLLILSLVIIIYFPVLSGFFFMDDFYFLSISQADNLRSFLNFFKPIKYIPYRPFSQQMFFFPLQKFFGLKPFYFHFLIVFVHGVNSFLLYKIIRKMTKDDFKAKLISLMYSSASLHFVGLFSITGSYIIFGIFYFLISLLMWQNFEKNNQKKLYLLSLLFFFLAIFSAEIAFSLPLIILLFAKKDKFKFVIPHFFLISFNLIINKLWAGAPKTKSFQLQFNRILSTLKWYFLRFLGLPEGIRNGYQWEKKLIYGGVFCLVSLILFALFKKRKLLLQNKKEFIRYFGWCLIGSFPFVLMPDHLNPIYFSVSFIAFLLFLSKILSKKIFFIYSFIFIVISFLSVRLLLHTHWTVRRSRLAEQKTYQLKKNCKHYNKTGQVMITAPDSDAEQEIKITLNNNLAMQLFCKNKNLKTIYKMDKK